MNIIFHNVLNIHKVVNKRNRSITVSCHLDLFLFRPTQCAPQANKQNRIKTLNEYSNPLRPKTQLQVDNPERKDSTNPTHTPCYFALSFAIFSILLSNYHRENIASSRFGFIYYWVPLCLISSPNLPSLSFSLKLFSNPFVPLEKTQQQRKTIGAHRCACCAECTGNKSRSRARYVPHNEGGATRRGLSVSSLSTEILFIALEMRALPRQQLLSAVCKQYNYRAGRK